MNQDKQSSKDTIDANWRSVSSVVEVITPSIAQSYLARNIANRPINNNQVAYYARQMKDGLWKANGEAISFDNNGNLINGQHRLSAIVKAGVSVAILVVRGVDKESFSTFDSGKNRSIADNFSLNKIPNANNISSIVSSYIMLSRNNNLIFGNCASSPLYNKNSAKIRLSKQEILDVYYSDAELFQTAHKFAQSCRNRLSILTVKFIGSVYVYLIKDNAHTTEKVERFFNMLTTESSFENKMISALRSILIKNCIIGSVSKKSPLYCQQLVTKAWNAFITNKELKVLRWDQCTENKLSFK